MKIEEKPTFATPYEWIGGEANVKALVERFYDLMDLEPSFARLLKCMGLRLTARGRRRLCFCAAG
jgi:hemoglobin